MGIIRIRIPAKANTIMTPKTMSHRKRSMSILVCHSGLSGRLTRNCRGRFVGFDGSGLEDVVDCTKTEEQHGFGSQRSSQLTWFWRRDTRGKTKMLFRDKFGRHEDIGTIEHIQRGTRYHGSLCSSRPLLPSHGVPPFLGTLRDGMTSKSCLPASGVHDCQPGPACTLPKPLSRDMHDLQPRQKEEHLAGSIKQGRGSNG